MPKADVLGRAHAGIQILTDAVVAADVLYHAKATHNLRKLVPGPLDDPAEVRSRFESQAGQDRL